MLSLAVDVGPDVNIEFVDVAYLTLVTLLVLPMFAIPLVVVFTRIFLYAMRYVCALHSGIASCVCRAVFSLQIEEARLIARNRFLSTEFQAFMDKPTFADVEELITK